MAGRPGSISHGEAGSPRASFWPALHPPSPLPSSPSRLRGAASSQLSSGLPSFPVDAAHLTPLFSQVGFKIRQRGTGKEKESTGLWPSQADAGFTADSRRVPLPTVLWCKGGTQGMSAERLQPRERPRLGLSPCQWPRSLQLCSWLGLLVVRLPVPLCRRSIVCNPGAATVDTGARGRMEPEGWKSPTSPNFFVPECLVSVRVFAATSWVPAAPRSQGQTDPAGARALRGPLPGPPFTP